VCQLLGHPDDYMDWVGLARRYGQAGESREHRWGLAVIASDHLLTRLLGYTREGKRRVYGRQHLLNINGREQGTWLTQAITGLHAKGLKERIDGGVPWRERLHRAHGNQLSLRGLEREALFHTMPAPTPHLPPDGGQQLPLDSWVRARRVVESGVARAGRRSVPTTDCLGAVDGDGIRCETHLWNPYVGRLPGRTHPPLGAACRVWWLEDGSLHWVDLRLAYVDSAESSAGRTAVCAALILHWALIANPQVTLKVTRCFGWIASTRAYDKPRLLVELAFRRGTVRPTALRRRLQHSAAHCRLLLIPAEANRGVTNCGAAGVAPVGGGAVDVCVGAHDCPWPG